MKPDFPKIMGILNITPDSFSDGGRYFNIDNAVLQAKELIEDGADIIDVGGESTRPGAAYVSQDDEISRVIPVIREINSIRGKVRISVDTRRLETARKAVKAGADIINDISGLTNDESIARVAAENNAGLVIMHMQGTPENMQLHPVYTDVVREVLEFLENKIELAKSYGVKDIYADIGIGFGKNFDHNIELLKNIDSFYKLGVPLVLGISRKSFLGKITGVANPSERDMATVLVHALLLEKKIDIIRVHNVNAATTLKSIYNTIK